MFNLIIILSMISVNRIQASSIPDACFSYCSNGGTCYQSNNGPKCLCSPQWVGERCHVRQNPTVVKERVPRQTDERSAQCNKLNPPFCQNNGICYVDSNDKFACYCRDPYIGDYCEEKSECDGFCIYGDCAIVANVPKCTCSPGWTGVRCGTRLTTTTTTESTSSTTSLFCNRLGSYCNSGTCVEVNGNAQCRCPPEFTGTQCNIPVQEPTPDPFTTTTSTRTPTIPSERVTCDQRPCKNGGQCYPNGSSYFCYCAYPYTGQTCDNTRQ